MKLPWLPLCGLASIVAGLVVLKVNPPLPPAFGGSFHGNIKVLSAMADAAAWAAIVAGFALLAFAQLASALWGGEKEGPGPTAEPTSPAPSRQSRPSGSRDPDDRD